MSICSRENRCRTPAQESFSGLIESEEGTSKNLLDWILETCETKALISPLNGIIILLEIITNAIKVYPMHSELVPKATSNQNNTMRHLQSDTVILMRGCN